MVFALIVTYADRYRFLEKTIFNCFESGVDKVFVVDNNSEYESNFKLRRLEERLSPKLIITYLNKNIGSAGGFKKGLEEIITEEDCEFIWLLDDDNVPRVDSLDVLKDFWNSLDQKNKQNNTSLLSYRPVKDSIGYKKAILDNNPNLVLGKCNSFLGFHFLDFPKKLFKFIYTSKNVVKSNIKSGLVSVAPYGGLFLHKDLLNTIGYPNERFFVYADDHDWTYRIIKNSGKIILILGSIIDDCDISWNVQKRTQSNFSSAINAPKFRLYFSTRNRIIFERKDLTRNNFSYLLNILIYSFLFFGYSFLSFRIRNLAVFSQAVYDGLLNNLDKNNIRDFD